jgi:type I restriction enzyme S subunit
MNAAQVLDYFNQISEAPDALLRLRRFILHLAMRGRFVRSKADWQSVTLGDLGEWGSGGTPAKSHPEYYGGHIPWLVIGDLNNSVVLKAETHITEAGLKNSSAKLVESGTVLIAMYGSIGKLGIAGMRCATNQAIAYCVPDEKIVTRQFLLLLLKALREDLLAKGQGGAQQNISQKILKSHQVRIPPLADQCAIVTEVDELMALCDRLEAARVEREATRSRLTTASLARLNVPDSNPGIFADHAGFALDNIASLTTRPDQVKQLRQAILDLAVRGYLALQDPQDESASELLKRIAAEKAKLAGQGGIRQRDAVRQADPGGLPFSVRPGWVAATIEQVLVELQTGPFGSSLHQSDYQVGGVPVVNPASIQNEQIIPIGKMAVGKATLERLASFKLRAGDIVMGRRGEMGRCAVVTEREAGWLCGTGSLILRTPSCVCPRFFVLLIGSPYVRQYLGGSAIGSTMQNLNQRILLNLVIGLPPLAEQRRIVAKVDELMMLCDRLEASLTLGESSRGRLLEVVLHEALAPTLEEAA